MNKLFKRIIGATLGFAMAIGVGVAVANNRNDVEATEAAIGTELASLKVSNDSGYGTRRTTTDSHSVGWVLASSHYDSQNTTYYIGTNNSTNHGKVKPTAADLPVVKAVKSDATTNTTGYYFYYTTTAVSNVGSVTFGYSALSASATAYIVVGDAKAASGGTAYTKIELATTSTASQGQTLSTTANSSYTFTFKQTQTSARYYGLVIQASANRRFTSPSLKLLEGATSQTYTASLADNSHATLSGTTSVSENTSLSITIVPDDHYHLKSSIQSVTMGDASYSGYTYNSSTGAFGITTVTGNVVISGVCEEDAKYTVTFTADTNGTGSYALTNQWSGSYELPDFEDISGEGKVNANSGYRFKNYTVGDDDKEPGETITLSAATNVTVNFEEQPKQAKYVISAVNAAALDSTINTVPTGAGFSFAATYTSNAYQMTAGNTQTWTLTGYNGKLITSLKIFIRNNSKSGEGTVALTNNSNAVTVPQSSFSGLGDTYAEHEILGSDLDVAGNVVLTLGCETNSFFCQYILVEWADKDILDDELSLDNYTDSFTVGDTFEFGGTATASYSLSGDVDVTDDVTFELAGNPISEGDTITADMVGDDVKVDVWYEDAKENAAVGSYTVGINYAAVESVTISTKTSEIAKTGTFTFGATVLPATANPSVTWSVEKKSGDITTGFSINSSTGLLTLTNADAGGTLTISATTVGKNSSDVSLTATCDVIVTGNPVVVVNSTLSGFSGKNTNFAYSFSNFTDTLSVVSADTNKVTVGTPTVTSGTSGSGTVQVNFVAATTTPVNISFKNGSDVIATCAVSVTASAVSNVEWTKTTENLTYYSGSTALTAAKILSWEPMYEMNNGDIGNVEADYTIKLNGTAYTPGTALTAGVYTLTLTYSGATTTLNNPTITVVQRLRNINAESVYLWETNGVDDFTSTSTVLNGITWTNTDPTYTNKTAGTTEKRYIQIGKGDAPESFTIRTSAFSGTITKITVDCASGSAGHTIAITVGGTSYLAATATPTWSSNNGGERIGTGTSSGEIVITFDKGDNTKAMYIHSIKVESMSNAANSVGHEDAQAAVVKFAKAFNTALGATEGCTKNLSTAWSAATSAWTTFTTEIAALGTAEEAYAKNLIKYATAQWTNDTDEDYSYCLERAMATYEKCVKSHGQTAFMSAVRPLGSNARINAIAINLSNNNIAAVIVILSMVSIAAVGGYFFLRKRKED